MQLSQWCFVLRRGQRTNDKGVCTRDVLSLSIRPRRATASKLYLFHANAAIVSASVTLHQRTMQTAERTGVLCTFVAARKTELVSLVASAKKRDTRCGATTVLVRKILKMHFAIFDGHSSPVKISFFQQMRINVSVLLLEYLADLAWLAGMFSLSFCLLFSRSSFLVRRMRRMACLWLDCRPLCLRRLLAPDLAEDWRCHEDTRVFLSAGCRSRRASLSLRHLQLRSRKKRRRMSLPSVSLYGPLHEHRHSCGPLRYASDILCSTSHRQCFLSDLDSEETAISSVSRNQCSLLSHFPIDHHHQLRVAAELCHWRKRYHVHH